MDDLNERVEFLRRQKTLNFCYFLVVLAYFLGVCVSVFLRLEVTGVKLILIYLGINITTSSLFVMIYTKNLPISKIPDQNLYQNLQVERGLVATTAAPLCFFIPLFICTVGIFFVQLSIGFKYYPIVYILTMIFLLIGIYRWWIAKKFLLSEYKRIHGHNYFSIFLY